MVNNNSTTESPLYFGEGIENQQAFVYRIDNSITQYPATATFSGEDVVPGFTLPLKKLL